MWKALQGPCRDKRDKRRGGMRDSKFSLYSKNGGGGGEEELRNKPGAKKNRYKI